MEPAGHKANSIGRCYLHEWEAHALYEAGYMLEGAANHQHYYGELSPEQQRTRSKTLTTTSSG
jgi:hypothetical protein